MRRSTARQSSGGDDDGPLPGFFRSGGYKADSERSGSNPPSRGRTRDAIDL